MTLTRQLQKAINSRALNTLNHIEPTHVMYEAQEEAKVSMAPMYLQEVPRTISMVAYKLANTSEAYDFSQYKRKSTYLEVRFEDKYYYEKVDTLLKDLDLSVFLEEII